MKILEELVIEELKLEADFCRTFEEADEFIKRIENDETISARQFLRLKHRALEAAECHMKAMQYLE